jgi:hypothetical protein
MNDEMQINFRSAKLKDDSLKENFSRKKYGFLA